MKRKLLLIIIILFSITLKSQNSTNSSNVIIKTEGDQELHFEKFVERACEALKILEENFQDIMSTNFIDNTPKLRKAFSELEKMFDKGALIQVMNSRGEIREYSVRDYFTRLRKYYLKKYNRYLEISFEIKCDKKSFRRTKSGISGNIKFRQKFYGENKEIIYRDITIKNVKLRSYTEKIGNDVNYYGVIFIGIDAEEIIDPIFSKPLPRNKM